MTPKKLISKGRRLVLGEQWRARVNPPIPRGNDQFENGDLSSPTATDPRLGTDPQKRLPAVITNPGWPHLPCGRSSP